MKRKSGGDSLNDWRHRRNDMTLSAMTATAHQRLIVILLAVLCLLDRLVGDIGDTARNHTGRETLLGIRSALRLVGSILSSTALRLTAFLPACVS